MNSSKYTPTQTETNSSLARVGKILVSSESVGLESPNGKSERKKEKQKILDKLE